MDDLTYESLHEALLSTLPELRGPYGEFMEQWGEGRERPGQHVLVGDLLNPWLLSLLSDKRDDQVLSRAFGFLERMANSGDERVVNVAAVTVLERLGGSPQLASAHQYMGPRTRELSRVVEAWWEDFQKGSSGLRE